MNRQPSTLDKLLDKNFVLDAFQIDFHVASSDCILPCLLALSSGFVLAFNFPWDMLYKTGSLTTHKGVLPRHAGSSVTQRVGYIGHGVLP